MGGAACRSSKAEQGCKQHGWESSPAVWVAADGSRDCSACGCECGESWEVGDRDGKEASAEPADGNSNGDGSLRTTQWHNRAKGVRALLRGLSALQGSSRTTQPWAAGWLQQQGGLSGAAHGCVRGSVLPMCLTVHGCVHLSVLWDQPQPGSPGSCCADSSASPNCSPTASTKALRVLGWGHISANSAGGVGSGLQGYAAMGAGGAVWAQGQSSAPQHDVGTAVRCWIAIQSHPTFRRSS